MIKSRSLRFSRIPIMLIGIALVFVTLFTTAMASGPSVNEALSSSCAVPFRVSASDSNFDLIGTDIDVRLAGELATARCAANELLSRAVLLGIEQDLRLAEEIASARDAVNSLIAETAHPIELFGGLYNLRLAEQIAGARVAAEGLVGEAASGIEFQGIAFELLLAEQIAAASDAVEGLVEEADLGIALDYRAAQDLAAAKVAVAELKKSLCCPKYFVPWKVVSDPRWISSS